MQLVYGEYMTTEVQTQTELTPAQRLAEANKVVRNYSIGAIAPVLVPVPVLDLALLSALQLKMLHSLSNVYGVKFSKNLGKEAISSLIGGAAPLSMTPMLASALKIIPGVGQIAGVAGGISLGVLGSSATYAIGKVFTQHFESGGTFLTFDPEKVREYFAKSLEEGKKLATETQSDSANSPTAKANAAA